MPAETDRPELPEGAQRAVLALAATVLGEMTQADIPAALVRVRAFAPARRARAGAVPLAAALEREIAFRQLVGAAWRAEHPELAEEIADGRVNEVAEPDDVLVGLYLLRPPEWVAVGQRARDLLAQRQLLREQELAQALAQAETTTGRVELDRLSAELDAREREVQALQQEIAAVRRELRRHRSDADRARAEARAALAEAAEERLRAVEAVQEAAEQSRDAQERLAEAEERAEALRQATRASRSLDDARVRLLLDAVVDAAGGLRRELALPPVVLRPADLIAGLDGAGSEVTGAEGVAQGAVRGRTADDPGLLADLLAVPQTHLVVDGYNVTKSGYPALPLVEQRRRLVEALAALATRTGAEVTCCFDSGEPEAGSAGVSGASLIRGVRVMFSAAGTQADELIRRLVRAEPPGRPLVVVSSDGEVASGVRRAGARAVDALALLRLLGRG